MLADLGCREWPTGPLEPLGVSADRLPQALLGGAAGDSALPYQDSQHPDDRCPDARLPNGRVSDGRRRSLELTGPLVLEGPS